MKPLFTEAASVLGRGQVLSAWDARNKYLAVVGANCRVRIYSRSGSLVDEFALLSNKNKVIYLGWDQNESDSILAVAQEQQSTVLLYDMNHSDAAKKVMKLNTELKKITWLSWNRDLLSIGSSKGNLLLYDKLTFRKQLIMGKHSKKILYGAWNKSNKLALVGKDRKLSLSDIHGNTLNENYLKQYPLDLQFGIQMSDNKKTQEKQKDEAEDTITMNMSGKTIYMFFLNNPSQPIELAFQAKYGEIVCYQWYGDGYILAGFSKGYVISISTHEKEMGEEIHCLRVNDDAHKGVVALSVCEKYSYAAVSTLSAIKIIDLSSFQEMKQLSFAWNIDYGTPKVLNWSKDSQILTVSTSTGFLLAYLIIMMKRSSDNNANQSTVHVFGDKHLAYLSSLQQVTVIHEYLSYDYSKKKNVDIGVNQNRQKLKSVIDVNVEPKLIAMGLQHVCVTFNTHCWCYALQPNGAYSLLFEHDFISEIQQIKLICLICSMRRTVFFCCACP